MSKYLVTVVALASLAGSAMAADLPVGTQKDFQEHNLIENTNMEAIMESLRSAPTAKVADPVLEYNGETNYFFDIDVDGTYDETGEDCHVKIIKRKTVHEEYIFRKKENSSDRIGHLATLSNVATQMDYGVLISDDANEDRIGDFSFEREHVENRKNGGVRLGNYETGSDSIFSNREIVNIHREKNGDIVFEGIIDAYWGFRSKQYPPKYDEDHLKCRVKLN